MKKINKVKNIFISRFLLLAMVLTALFFYSQQPKFFSFTNIMDIMLTASITGIMAIGGMIAMAAGEINFAIGSQAMVSAAIIGWYMDQHSSYLVALLLVVAFAVLNSLLIGYVVIELKVPAFIATLAMQTILKGFTRIFSGDQPFTSSRWPAVYTFLGQTELFGLIPLPVLLFVLIGIVSHITTQRTRMGRYLFSVGSDPTACHQVGINTRKVRYWAFIISGLLASFAGVIHTSETATVTLKIADELLMPALCAVLLSATYYKIGFYNIPGTIISSVLLILIQNGVLSIGAQYYVKDILQGAVLLIAVSVIALTRKGGLPKVTFEST